jgi:hypothetical protein
MPKQAGPVRKLLQGLHLIPREHFEFDLHLVSVTNWQTFGAIRRFSIRWQRGDNVRSVHHVLGRGRCSRRAQRAGVSSAVYPVPLKEGETTRRYDFKETITLSAVLYKARH